MMDSSETDTGLVRRIAAGDRAAFDRLYRRYERRTLGFAYSFVADRSVADDVLIETMVAVWLGARQFRAGSRVSTWILGIARHKALDAARRATAHQSTLRRVLDQACDGVVATPADVAQRNEGESAVRRAMVALTAAHQEVLRLAFFEELPYEEIGRRIGVPVNTVKTRIFHAKRQLRRELGDGVDARPARCPQPTTRPSGSQSAN